MKQLLTIFLLTITAITSLTLTTPQVEATTSNYQFDFTHSYYEWGGTSQGTLNNNVNYRATSKIEIINDSIIINQTNNWLYLYFWNNNTYLGWFNNQNISNVINHAVSTKLGSISNNQITLPQNATHFAFSTAISAFDPTWNIGTYGGISSSLAQTLTVSYNTPAPAWQPEAHYNLIGQNIGSWSYGFDFPIETIGAAGDTTFNNNDLYTMSHYIPVYGTQWFTSDPSAIGKVYYYTSAGILISFTSTIDNENTIPTNAGSMRTLSPLNTDVTPVIYLDPNTATQVIYQDYQGNGLGTFNLNPGTSLTNLDTQFSSDPNIPREGFTFEGWSSPFVVGTTNIIKVPLYTSIPSYTVTFTDYNGTVLGTDTVYEGQPASPPVIPTRTGYTFDSWLPPIADIQGNITTVAQYTPNTYLATWTSDSTEIKAEQVAHDSTILSHAPFVTKEDHVLTGWESAVNNQLITSGQLVTGPLSLTAVWEQVPTYTVTWRDPSFNTLKIEYIQESGLATAPTYDPGSGLVLTGWTPDPTQSITENTIFIATVTNAPAPPTVPGDYSPISDLFGGVIGASIGAVMTLGTIDLYGIQLSAIIYLFVSMSLGLWILKAIRG